MKNKEVKGILALVVVTARSFGVIIGSKSLALSAGGDASGESSETLEEFDVSGAENIEKAGKTEDGYLVTVRTKGYVGDIVMDVAFDSSASRITEVQVVEQSETDGLGSKITEPEFLDQFKGAEAPVFLPGMDGVHGWRILMRDRHKHASPNSAQAEAACAGALHLRLAGDAWYFGILHKKPFIGDDDRPVCPMDIKRANRLMFAAEVILMAVLAAALFLA